MPLHKCGVILDFCLLIGVQYSFYTFNSYFLDNSFYQEVYILIFCLFVFFYLYDKAFTKEIFCKYFGPGCGLFFFPRMHFTTKIDLRDYLLFLYYTRSCFLNWSPNSVLSSLASHITKVNKATSRLNQEPSVCSLLKCGLCFNSDQIQFCLYIQCWYQKQQKGF